MMKNYYYCEANDAIYTEKEMNRSKWPSGRFEKIGAFEKREEAEIAYMNKNPLVVISVTKRI